jgi:hypothetical protein
MDDRGKPLINHYCDKKNINYSPLRCLITRDKAEHMRQMPVRSMQNGLIGKLFSFSELASTTTYSHRLRTLGMKCPGKKAEFARHDHII